MLVLVAAVFLAYQPAWRAGFIWDDDAHVMPPDLRSWHGLWRIWFEVGAVQQYYPLLHTFSWLEFPLFGENPLGYHVVNIGVHALNAVLLWRLLRRLQVPGAPWAAAVFALHPVMVESVAWITEIKNTLSGLFCLAATLVYLRFEDNRRGRTYALALFLFTCAVLSKTTTAVLPGVLLVLAWWRRGRLDWRRDWLPMLPLVVVGAADGLGVAWVEWRVIGAQGSDFAFTLVERCLIAGRAAWFYAGKIVWPADLLFFYPRWTIRASDVALYLYPAAAFAVLAGLWLLRRRTRGPLAVALLFLGLLAPILGFLNVYLFVFSFVADHLQYLGSIALIAGLCAGGAILGRRWSPSALRGLAVAILALLAVLTWRQCRMYRDEETLYRVTLAQNPDAWLAHGNLGGLLVKAGHNEEAIEHLAIARRFHPEKIEINYNLGLAYLRLHRPAEAAPLFQAVLQTRPDDVESLGNLGDALVQQDRLAEAIPHYERAVQLRPELAGVQNNLGNALLATGRLEAAVAHLEQATRLQPDNAEAHFNLGLVLAHLGRLSEAIAHDEAALRLKPDDAGAQLNLAEALLQAGRAAESIPHFREALRLDPTMTEARQGLDLADRALPQGPLR
jgi:tetratricopeptide (TPR) repeat protein